MASGPADEIVIYEAPDAITAETVQLFTMEEAMTAMTKAGQLQKSHKPPTARCERVGTSCFSREAVLETATRGDGTTLAMLPER